MEPSARFIAAMLRYDVLPVTDLERFAAALRPLSIHKGGRFLQEGQDGVRLAFVEQGIFRFFYTEEDGSEATRAFVMEGGFLTARVSMIRNDPAPFTIEALEDSRLLVFPREAFHLFDPADPVWLRLILSLCQERLDHKDRRIKGFLTKDAAGRYLDFLAEYPGIESRVRQHHVASYLGMTPVSLSRVRAKLKKENKHD